MLVELQSKRSLGHISEIDYDSARRLLAIYEEPEQKPTYKYPNQEIHT
jgi:hypothetical protein